MTNELEQLLTHLGYSGRPEQAKLFDHLIKIDHQGVVAQAGTGVGKSIAVLAAAAHLHKREQRQVTVITPTILLMAQYMKADAPAAAEVFGLTIKELKGRSHYACSKSIEAGARPEQGCIGEDAKCTMKNWSEGIHSCEPDPDNGAPTCDEIYPCERGVYTCGYQAAKAAAAGADIVITNTDMFLVNEKFLAPRNVALFDPEGPLLVDEAHQLESKLTDWAGSSTPADWLQQYRTPATIELAKFIRTFDREPMNVKNNPKTKPLVEAAVRALGYDNDPKSRAMAMAQALGKILPRLDEPESPNYVIWADGQALKLSWINVAASAREILTARPFGLVSATVPGSMPASLGVADAKIIDVGHPFDYKKQATLSICQVNGAYQYAKERSNLVKRTDELKKQVLNSGGGALLLFSSFRDLEAVYEECVKDFRAAGLLVLKHDGNADKADLSAQFKQSKNAVLFGSESFATGFDVPGDSLRLLCMWKLPYAGMDPVTRALMKNFPARYNDLMLTRATQAIGRLIRTTSDTGHVWIGDSRAEGKLLGDNSLMTKHLKEFKCLTT